jgi:cation diffusion facilitator CzcD-associated flavoprotein CzcO/pimeloyl-ACP methyl ester carboxylesterase
MADTPEDGHDAVEDDARAFDVVIIGAGFGGMYSLLRLRRLGLRIAVFDEAGGVGGTWWWNRYPGARVDFPGGPFYCYTFSEELVREWDWTETHPDQPAVLAYLEHVADRFDLRRDIRLNTKVSAAAFDESAQRWTVETSDGERVTAQFLISSVGTLSAPYTPDISGIGDFAGPIHHTGHWPQDADVDFTGKRVGVIGTGSSGVQVMPMIADRAAHLTVFQRTPQYAVPARNQPIAEELIRESKENWAELRRRIIETGRIQPRSTRSAFDDTDEERRRRYEAAWAEGSNAIMACYADLLTDPAANRTAADFVRSKIRELVEDPAVAQRLMPDYFFGTKRQIMDEGYYEMFNRENVTLVDLREDPIESVTADSVRTRSGEHAIDVLILATGYDAISGALRRLGPVGRDGLGLQDRWRDGARTYLGLAVAGFPNLFMIHGPQTPSVMFHMPLGAELQGDWIADCITYMRERGLTTVEPDADAEAAWGAEVQAVAATTLYPQTDSWFTGANIPGKAREFTIYVGGPQYHRRLREVAADDYRGFTFGTDPQVSPTHTPEGRMIHDRTLRVDSFDTHFLEAGEPGAQPVVLLHDGAFGADGTIAWERLIPLLDRFHVIVPDLLGWGTSDAGVILNRDRFEYRAHHVGRLLELLGVTRPAHFVGASFSGSLVLHTLVKYPRYWNIASAVSITGDGGAYRHPENFTKMLKYDGSRESMVAIVEYLIDADSPDFDRQVDYRQLSARRAGNFQAASAPRLPRLPDEVPNPSPADAIDLNEGLAATTTPVLLVAGDRDSLLLPDWPEQLQQLAPNVQIARIDARHSPGIDHADELAKTLTGFFEQVRAPGQG